MRDPGIRETPVSGFRARKRADGQSFKGANTMNLKRLWSAGTTLRSALAAAAVLAAPAVMHAQQATVSGQVKAATGEVLPDSRVMVVGTSISTLTSAEGRYILRNVPTGT